MEGRMKNAIEKKVSEQSFSFVNFVQCIKFDYANSCEWEIVYVCLCARIRKTVSTTKGETAIFFFFCTKSKYALNKSIYVKAVCIKFKNVCVCVCLTIETWLKVFLE